MKFVTQAIKVTPKNHIAVQQKLRGQGYRWINGKEFVPWHGKSHPHLGTNDKGYIFRVNNRDASHYLNQLTAEEFLKDTTKPFYIYTPTLEIMQSVQRRLNDLGYKLNEKAYIISVPIENGAFKEHYKYIHFQYDKWGHNGANYPGENEVSIKELFSDDFPRYVAPKPVRRIPKGELLPDYEVVVKEKEIKIPGLGVTIPVESIRNLAAALATAQPEKLKNVYIHTPGPELMQFVYDKLRSMGYDKGFADVSSGSYIGIAEDYYINWDNEEEPYSEDSDYKEMTIQELFTLKTPALPGVEGYPVSLKNGKLKIGCQELSLESFNNFAKSL